MIRPQVLTAEEGLRLPSLCNPVRGGHTVVARADFTLSMGDIVQLAVRMSKAVPDAEIVFHELRPPTTGRIIDKLDYAQVDSAIDAETQNPTEDIIDVVEYEEEDSQFEHGLAVHNPVSIFDRIDEELAQDELEPPPLIHWWDFVQVGDVDTALSLLQDKTLSHDDQVHIRNLFKSDVPEWIVFICYASRVFNWKTMALTIRKAFHNQDYRVRKAAVAAVGELAGPSMAPSVYPLQTDIHPEVRRAATMAYRKLDR